MILDTNALSAAADRESGAMELISNAAVIAVPVIVLGEYRLGIVQSRRKSAYERWLSEWIAAVNVLNIDEATTLHYAAIGLELKSKGKLIGANDLWIAALCRQYRLPLLSRDRHFDVVDGIRRLEW